jgi:hypothetical protein
MRIHDAIDRRSVRMGKVSDTSVHYEPAAGPRTPPPPASESSVNVDASSSSPVGTKLVAASGSSRLLLAVSSAGAVGTKLVASFGLLNPADDKTSSPPPCPNVGTAGMLPPAASGLFDTAGNGGSLGGSAGPGVGGPAIAEGVATGGSGLAGCAPFFAALPFFGAGASTCPFGLIGTGAAGCVTTDGTTGGVVNASGAPLFLKIAHAPTPSAPAMRRGFTERPAGRAPLRGGQRCLARLRRARHMGQGPRGSRA